MTDRHRGRRPTVGRTGKGAAVPTTTDDRGVSAVLGYVMVLGIVTLLVGGLFLTAGNFVENQHERVIRSEFEVVGNRLAADLAAVDRLALAAGSGGQASLDVDLPPLAAGRSYQIDISSAPPSEVYFINVSTTESAVDVSVTVKVRLETFLAETTVDGGDVSVVYDGSQLEVRDG